ncbi:hypothetical protein KRX57_00620 [Weeksellaceae bacterium TAE3-ERU29]|nr:hypothetical protein [Weeksellaceae bacterium TAE3-ERU29]
MEVIALKGEANCGKTQTLNIVYSLLLKKGCIQKPNAFKDLGSDCLDAFTLEEESAFTIGIITQGDYAIGDCSVKKHLEELKSLGCDIAICACTIGISKNKIKEAIEEYKYTYVSKGKSSQVSLQRIENFKKAIEIINLLNDKLISLAS